MLEIIYLFSIIVIGASIGSFINVYVYRAPKILIDESTELSLSKPNSYCPNCTHPVERRFLIPIIGYFLTQGKCHHCSQKISIRYPIVESFYAFIPVLIYFLMGINSESIILIVLLLSAYPIIAIDMKHKLLLDSTTLSILWVVLILSVFDYGLVKPSDAIMGAVVGYLILSIPAFIYKLLRAKDGMGMGDAKLFSAIGATFGWLEVPFILLISSLLGILMYIVLSKKTNSKNLAIPFGPSIIIAAIISHLHNIIF